ncbi:MAG TPA: L-aspartate oxidase [Abditibacteriaceae bacterium]|nr:L-aspartate oxidase [Abditibacteriaceae bacterium]
MPFLLPFDPVVVPTDTFDFLIIGSGVAGLSSAIELAPHGTVAVITKEGIGEGSTQWAQGGIAAALAPEPFDSFALHEQDTLQAGAGLCDRAAVQVLVTEGPQRVHELIARGAHFDTEATGELKLTREAAHRARRIIHAQGDSTGREVQRSLAASVFESAGIKVFENTLTVDLLLTGGRCCGALALDTATGALRIFRAAAIIIATGGIGALYKVTTNPPVLTGDGIAMACRAGAALMDMEFVQFHPTAFAKGPEHPKFLISEAVRGEGAILLNNQGERFMPRYHPDAELAPRDVVSRAIAEEIVSTQADFVLLDLTANSAQEIAARFPTIYATCVAYGIDPAHEPVPVSPAAHYMMGGIHTDLNGATNVPGLLACGECACTGVHGANRLASNSMLEGLVFGIRTVEEAIQLKSSGACSAEAVLAAVAGGAAESSTPADVSEPELREARLRLQETMWRYVGLVRSAAGLQLALRTLDDLELRYGRPAPSRQSIELANMITTARLVTRAALARTESRGAHYRADYPHIDDVGWHCHLLLRCEDNEFKVERLAVE